MRMGNAIYAAVNPIAQIHAAPMKSFVLSFLMRLQVFASLGSAGQRLRVEYNCQADSNSRPPEIRNIHIL